MFRRLALSIAIFVLLTPVFCVGGYFSIATYIFIWGPRLDAALTTWHSLGRPTEPINTIAVIYWFSVCDGGAQIYLETDTGKILRCEGSDQQWHETTRPIEPVSGWYFSLLDGPGQIGWLRQMVGLPPGIKDTSVKVAAMLSGFEYSGPIYFVVGKDNSVWRWQANGNAFILGLLLLVGLLGGGYLLVIVWPIFRLYKKPKVKEVAS